MSGTDSLMIKNSPSNITHCNREQKEYFTVSNIYCLDTLNLTLELYCGLGRRLHIYWTLHSSGHIRQLSDTRRQWMATDLANSRTPSGKQSPLNGVL